MASQLPLPIASYRLSNINPSSARLRNAYPEQAAPGNTRQPLLLRRAPGITALVDLTTSDMDTVRGMGILDGVLYALVGSTLYRVSDQWVGTDVGTVPGSERVRMLSNQGGQLGIVTPATQAFYVCDGTATAQVTDPIFLGWGAIDFAYIDGYFTFVRPNSNQIFNTGLNNTVFNALDITSIDGSPGNLLGILADHRELFLPKTEGTSELWYNAANAVGSPFSRSPNGYLTLGSPSGATQAPQDNSIFWLGNDLTVRRLDAVTPTRVSQHGIEAILQQISLNPAPGISDAFGLSFVMGGHLFYAQQFPNGARTIVYDCTTQQWHERDSLGYGRWRPNCIVEAYGKQIVGDSFSGKIGFLDPRVFTEFGEPQRASWTYQPLYAKRDRLQCTRFELGINNGTGTYTGQASNPLATLKKSVNFGQTYTTMPVKRLGGAGQYGIRTAWTQLGQSEGMVFQVDITDPIDLFVTDTLVDVIGGRL